MADACARCSGHGWTWNGQRRVPCMRCMRCSPHLRGQRIPDPGKDWAWRIPVAEWPAVRAALMRRRLA